MLPWPSIIKKLGKDILNGNLEVMEIFCWLKNGQPIGGERLTLLYVSFVRDINALILIHGLIPSN